MNTTSIKSFKNTWYLICFSYFFYQLHKSAVKLMEPSVLSTTTTEERSTMKMPSITICRWRRYFNLSRPRLINNEFSEIISQQELIPLIKFGRNNYPNFADQAHYPLENRTYNETWSLMWIPDFLSDIKDKDYACYTFNPPMVVPIGAHIQLTIYINNTVNTEYYMGTLLYIHPRDMLYPTVKKYLGSDWIMVIPTQGRSNASTSNALYNIKQSVNNKLPTNKYPCEKEHPETINMCLERYLSSKLNCYLPWQRNNNAEARLCDNETDYDTLSKIHKQLLASNTSQMMELLNCKLPCCRDEYSFEHMYNAAQCCPSFFEDRLFCNQLNGVIITARDGNVNVITEKWFYDLNNFVADIGGFLGLLVGWSVMTFYELGAEMFQSLLIKVRNKKVDSVGNTDIQKYQQEI